MTEQEYRKVKRDSQSSIKIFYEDRKKYMKKYVLQDSDDEEPDNKAAIIGSLVDCITLSPHYFDEKFYISRCINPPTGLMLQFVEKLYEETVINSDSTGSLTTDISVLLKNAYDKVKYDEFGNVVAFKRDSFAIVVDKFKDDVRNYYDELCATRYVKKILITPKDIENAEKVKSSLLTNRVTSQIMNLTTNSRFTVYNQYPILFKYKDLELKALLDKIVIDHEEKTIKPYDLKTTWDVEEFFKNYYLYRKSYIQAAIYNIACLLEFQDLKYKVMPLSFIVSDPYAYNSPLIYKLDESLLYNSYTGFSFEGRNYKGTDILIDELKWHKQMNIWNISMENHLNNGIVTLKDDYGGKF